MEATTLAVEETHAEQLYSLAIERPVIEAWYSRALAFMVDAARKRGQTSATLPLGLYPWAPEPSYELKRRICIKNGLRVVPTDSTTIKVDWDVERWWREDECERRRLRSGV